VQNYILTVCPVLALSPNSLPGGSVGTAYSQTIVASGGTAPYRYIATGLPSSLTLSDSTGVLSGAPTAAGTFNFTVTASDANACAISQSYTIRVTDVPPVITDLNLGPGAGGNFDLAVTGSGFVNGAVIVVDGVSYPATFVSPTLVTVTLPASAIPATGTVIVTVTNPGATGATSNPATLTFCSAPDAPVNPTIVPFGNPTGPLTATDFLLVRWEAPAGGPPPAAYEFRINGDSYTTVTGTSAIAPPRGSNDPITLYVRALCNADVSGPEVPSQTYSLAPPVADFTFSAARVNSPVSFTDTSSPQATSWLWIFDDGAIFTVQSPVTHTFTTAGTHRVALIASNGSGSSQTIKDVSVSASTSGSGVVTSSLRFFETFDGRRWNLPEVAISGDRSAWLELTTGEAETEAIVYLRFVDTRGQAVLERRLSIAPGQTAVNDVSAYGLEGLYTLEIVADRKVIPILAEPAELPERERRKPDDRP
jgi:PKD repeat protein